MSQFYTGSNAKYGKRKIGRTGDSAAGALSKRLFFKKGSGASPLLNTKSIEKIINKTLKKRMITPPEQRYFETTLTASTISTTSVMTLLSGVLQGDTPGTRTGSKIRVTKIELVGLVEMSDTAVTGSDNGKISIFIHKQANGVAPGAFAGTPSSSATAPYNSNGAVSYPLLKNSLYEDEFYIIKDWDFTLDANAYNVATTAWQQDSFNIKAEIPINRVIKYNAGNAGTIVDCIKNAIYIGYVGTQAPGAAASFITWYSRIWFTDA